MLMRLAGSTLIALAVGACAGTPSTRPAPVAQKDTAMTSSAVNMPEPALSPKLTAEQALNKLLDLFRTGVATNDLTPELLSDAFGTELRSWEPNEYQFSEQVTPDWRYGLNFRPKAKLGARFSFGFSTDPEIQGVAMTDICQMDFDRFSTALVDIGFERTVRYGKFERVDFYIFTRPGKMSVEVYVRGEANTPIEKISHKCVQMVLVQ